MMVAEKYKCVTTTRVPLYNIKCGMAKIVQSMCCTQSGSDLMPQLSAVFSITASKYILKNSVGFAGGQGV